MKETTKDLFGQNIFPVAVGRSQIKLDGKLKSADYQPRYIRDFVGAPNNSLMTAGQTLVALNETGTVGTSPFTYQTTNHGGPVLRRNLMEPEASVSALMFQHPDCTYFTAGEEEAEGAR
jgi:hypothetical protein